VIEVKNLRKAFGELVAVDNLSFAVAEGEIYGLLGPNGAGKTTTISMICGLLAPDGGAARIAGMDVRAEPGRVKALMGYVPQEIALYEDLSALENVGFWGRLYGLSGRELDRRAREILTRVGLWDRAKEAVKKYSGGMKRRVNLAAALLHEPRLLLLDEPTVGIDPQARLAIQEIIREVAAAGTTILYTTHYMDEAERLCHRIGIMDHGRLLAEGTLAELVSLVGDGRIITLGGKFEAGRLEGALRDRPDIRVLTLEDGRGVFVARGQDTLVLLVKALFEQGVPVEDISVKDPSLESLFIKLTGKELRD
jgi:ABC-2 type transport system ATP-binding protein